jgi:DNA-3-methyladenine glycosylase II
MDEAEARAAHRHLLTADPRLAPVVADHGLVSPYDWPGIPLHDGNLLEGLVLHIVAQQISTAAALAIFGRLRALVGAPVDAGRLARATESELRAVGLSGAKARALRELGELVGAGVLDLDQLRERSDDEAQERLVALRGIGPWSAQMFLLHELRRPDVFPAGDVALRNAIARLDALPAPPPIPDAVARAEVWQPFRSYAAAHLWRLNREPAGRDANTHGRAD